MGIIDPLVLLGMDIRLIGPTGLVTIVGRMATTVGMDQGTIRAVAFQLALVSNVLTEPK